MPAFLIVGSPRSGTTLVQRLATEFRGVAIPPETHFFTHLARRLLTLPRPLDPGALRAELHRYLGLRLVEGLELDVDAVIEDLGGTCEGPLDVFASMLRTLCGNAPVMGEKTPMNLLWWRPLTRALPSVRLVSVVREPRAVVASTMAVPWGPVDHVVLAEAWSIVQEAVARAADRLGPERFLVLRYEDVVTDPGAARRSLATFLEIDAGDAHTPLPSIGRDDAADPDHQGARGYLPWETWKREAWGPITTDRVEAWRSILSSRQAAEVSAICRRQMLRFGYEGVPTRGQAILRLARVSPVTQGRRLSFRLKWNRRVRKIERIEL